MRRNTIALLILLAICALVAMIKFQRGPPSPPNLSIKVAGCTNDSSGTRWAVITVTNLSDYRVFAYRPSIEIPAPTQPGGVRSLPLPGWRAMLRRGESANFSVVAPTNQTQWRLMFLVYHDFAPGDVIKKYLTLRRHMPADIHSDWFASGKTATTNTAVEAKPAASSR